MLRIRILLYFDADPDPIFFTLTRIRIQILFLIKVMQIYDHLATELLRIRFVPFVPRRLYFVYDPPFGPLQLLTFDSDLDSDPILLLPLMRIRIRSVSRFLSVADPDPAS